MENVFDKSTWVFEDVPDGIDKGEPVHVVYLDFMKAFDAIQVVSVQKEST